MSCFVKQDNNELLHKFAHTKIVEGVHCAFKRRFGMAHNGPWACRATRTPVAREDALVHLADVQGSGHHHGGTVSV